MSPRPGLWILGGALALSLTANILLLAARGISIPETTAASRGETLIAPALTPSVRSAPLDVTRDQWNKWLDDTTKVAQRDFDAALKLLDTRPSETSRDSALAQLIMSVCREHLDRLEELLPKSSASYRNGIWENVLDHWAEVDPGVLLEFARKAPSGAVKTYAYRTLVENLARDQSFEAASSALTEMPTSRERDIALMEVTRKMAEVDAESALTWVQALPSSKERIRMQSYLVSAFRKPLGMERLSDLASTSKEAEVKVACVQAMVELLPEETKPADIDTWLRSLPADLRNSAISRLSETFAPDDPIAWSGLLQSIEDLQQRDLQIGNLSANVASLDPRQAVEFAASFQSPGDQESAMRTLLRQWRDVDIQASEQWVQSLPPGQFKDSALIGLVWNLDFSDRPAARATAQQISDPKRRAKILKWVGN